MLDRDELAVRLLEAMSGHHRGGMSAAEVVAGLDGAVRQRVEAMTDAVLGFIGETATGFRKTLH